MITMNASSTPRRYSDEQKAEAIDFCLKENLSCAKAAQRLGLHPSILNRWLRQYRIDQGEALPVDRGLLNTSERDELIKLRKENRELRREKDFFKLAAAHYGLPAHSARPRRGKDQLPQKGFG